MPASQSNSVLATLPEWPCLQATAVTDALVDGRLPEYLRPLQLTIQTPDKAFGQEGPRILTHTLVLTSPSVPKLQILGQSQHLSLKLAELAEGTPLPRL